MVALCGLGFHSWEYFSNKVDLFDDKGKVVEYPTDVYQVQRKCKHCGAHEIPLGLFDWKRISPIEYGDVIEKLLRLLLMLGATLTMFNLL